MKKSKISNTQFLKNISAYGANLEEAHKGVVPAVIYILRNSQNKDLLKTINNIINEYFDMSGFTSDIKKEEYAKIGTKRMPEDLALEIIKKSEKLKVVVNKRIEKQKSIDAKKLEELNNKHQEKVKKLIKELGEEQVF